MHAIILSIGDELTGGLTVNTNSAWLSEQLAAVGVATAAHVTVGDQLTRIVSAIKQACETLEADGGGGGVLLITGGLGPTEDDVTRQALADALQESLVEDPDAVLQIEGFFKALHRPMAASNRLQALRPHSASIMENTVGTAPGLRARHGRTEIFVMPGVPKEMKEMFARFVIPAIGEQLARYESPGARVTLVRKINTFGRGESVVGEAIRDLMARDANPGVGTTVHEGIVSVRIYATGAPEAAATMIDGVRKTVYERLGPIVIGEDDQTLEQAVAQLLKDRRKTIATAESCTGGILAAMLTDTPGSSAYFLRGWVTYANAAKTAELGVPEALLAQHGAVSEPAACAMAEGAQRLANTDFALAITGIAGPDGGSPEKPVGTVWIALADAEGIAARRYLFPGDRRAVRLRAAQTALALLRWKLLGVAPPA